MSMLSISRECPSHVLSVALNAPLSMISSFSQRRGASYEDPEIHSVNQMTWKNFGDCPRVGPKNP